MAGADGETALLVPPGDAGALAATLLRALADEVLRARVAAAGRRRTLGLFTWPVTARRTAEQYRIILEEHRGLLTVDFERLGLRPGERVLDLGCGAGRHAFECLRRGATVVALDSDPVELKGVAALMVAMGEAGEVPAGAGGTTVRATATGAPVPRRQLRQGDRRRGARAHRT